MAASKGSIGGGITLIVVGSAFLVIGLALSFTLIGACFGIPLIFLAVVIKIIGWMLYLKARHVQQDAVLQRAVSENVVRTPMGNNVPKPTKTCKACGAAMEVGQNFCPSCGLDQR